MNQSQHTLGNDMYERTNHSTHYVMICKVQSGSSNCLLYLNITSIYMVIPAPLVHVSTQLYVSVVITCVLHSSTLL